MRLHICCLVPWAKYISIISNRILYECCHVTNYDISCLSRLPPARGLGPVVNILFYLCVYHKTFNNKVLFCSVHRQTDRQTYTVRQRK